MIVADISGIAMSGRQGEAVAALKDFVAYVESRWPAAAPRQVWVETSPEQGRIHLVVMWESMAADESNAIAQSADAQRNARAEKVMSALLAGSMRRTYLRTA